MIVLYDYWRSSAAYRVRIALNHLGLDYRAVPVDLLTGAHRMQDNIARNPQGLVPTLEIDGLRLTQSLAILEYLHETRGGLLPEDPGGRARVRAIAYAIAMEIAPVANLTVRNRVADLAEGRISADDWQREVIVRGFAAVEMMLDPPLTGPYCHGNMVSTADLCLIPQVYNAERMDVTMTDYPAIMAVATALRALPAVIRAHPDAVRP